MKAWSLAVITFILLAAAGPACNGRAPEVPDGATDVQVDLPGGATLDALELGDGPNVAILSHGATGEMDGFYPLMPLLDAGGWHAIAYDAQGVGDSTGEPGSDRPGDLAAMVEYARDSGAERIVLVGASLGAVVSIEAAGELKADGVVALSPYAATRVFPRIPLMLAVAEDNEPYATQTRQLGEDLDVIPVFVTGDNHGTGMFAEHPELMNQVITFLNEEVAAVAPSASAGQ